MQKIKNTELSTSQQPFHFELECLEDRMLLAGDVSVTLVGNTLQMVGDDSSNRIELVGDGDTIFVAGQGTDLNGEDDVLEFARSNVQDIIIDLGDGNDRVSLIAQNANGLAFGDLNRGSDTGAIGNLSINLGAGNDRVTLAAENNGDIGFMMDLNIQTGPGNDRVQFDSNNSGVAGFQANRWDIATGPGNDRVNFAANNQDSIGFLVNTMTVETAAGNDRVEYEANNVGESVGFSINSLQTMDEETGQSFGDPIGFWRNSTGSGNDRINIEANNDGGVGFQSSSMNFLTGDGNDRIAFEFENEGDSVGMETLFGSIRTNEGDDRVSIVADHHGDGSHGMLVHNELNIATEEGRDRVEMKAENSAGIGFEIGQLMANPSLESLGNLDGLTISTGDEDDRVDLSANNSGGQSAGFGLQRLDLRTGAGDDRVQVKGNNSGDNTVGIVIVEEGEIRLQDGDDSLTLAARQFLSLAFEEFTIDGGAGDGDRIRANFELEPDDHINFEDPQSE